MKNKKLSIIVPCYNGEKFIKKNFESFKNIIKNEEVELIYVNDGSTDKSIDLLNIISKENKNVAVYSKKNGGLSSSRNYGLKKAKGKYIYFSDIDDFVSKDFSKLVLETLNLNNDLFIFNFNVIENNESKKSWIKLPKNGTHDVTDLNNINEEFINGNLTNIIGNSVWNKIYLKEIIDKNNIKFIEKRILNEDVFFNIEYINSINNYYVNDESIYNYIIHNNSITRNHKTWLIEALENNYELVKEISIKYNYNDYDKYIMKIIIPFTLTLLRNEKRNINGKENLNNFFNSKSFKYYFKNLDKKCLTSKEKLYYFLIYSKLYKLVFKIVN